MCSWSFFHIVQQHCFRISSLFLLSIALTGSGSALLLWKWCGNAGSGYRSPLLLHDIFWIQALGTFQLLIAHAIMVWLSYSWITLFDLYHRSLCLYQKRAVPPRLHGASTLWRKERKQVPRPLELGWRTAHQVPITRSVNVKRDIDQATL